MIDNLLLLVVIFLLFIIGLILHNIDANLADLLELKTKPKYHHQEKTGEVKL